MHFHCTPNGENARYSLSAENREQTSTNRVETNVGLKFKNSEERMQQILQQLHFKNWIKSQLHKCW